MEGLKIINLTLTAYSWISTSLGAAEYSAFNSSQQVKEGTTFGAFFCELAASHPEFRQQVFDPGTGKVSAKVILVVNKRIVQWEKIINTEIRNNDNLILTPIILGG